MKSTAEQIQLAIACTTCRGDEIPNCYRVRNWLISEYGSWLSPTMNQIRAHLGSSDAQPEEHELWVSHTSKPARSVYKTRKEKAS